MVKLDKQQQAIVDSDASKICVIAGAGSGKTRVVIERIRRLLKEGKNPYGFVCITFTKMAAQEMRSRLSDIPGHEKMFIGTIHSFAYKILSQAGIRANLLTPEKEREITRTLIHKYAKHLTLEKYDEWANKHRLMQLGYYKRYEVESSLTTEEAMELAILFDHIDLKHIYESMPDADVDALIKRITEYENSIKRKLEYPETMRSTAQRLGMITFNGLLEQCKAHSYKQRIAYLFVDEFQDVGAFEYKFLTGLDAEHVFVVGDDYQCQPGDAQILMADGSYKLLKKIQLGDIVQSWDFNLNQPAQGTVKSIQKSTSEGLMQVNTNKGKVSKYTFNHKCYAQSGGCIEAKLAGNLSLSDSMLVWDSTNNTLKTNRISRLCKLPSINDQEVVYSLDIDCYHNYIADNILTHNSIYGFKGADFEYFKSLANNPEYTTYKMENNYRCEKHIVDFGDRIITQISDVIPKKCVSKVKPLTKGSLIYRTGGIKMLDQFLSCIDGRDYGKWFLLTRSNNDLVDVSRMCYRKNIPTVTFKKSGMSEQSLNEVLQENSIKLLTVHSAKGLESENVLLYGSFPTDQTEEYWKSVGTEECRIFYVGATRAKKNLVVVSNHEEKALKK